MPPDPIPIPSLTLFVDADGCPVKEEIYRIARRHRVPVVLVANAWLRIPDGPLFHLEVVGSGFDEADDWIVAQARAGDVAVTSDIPLAARLLQKDARVVSPYGKEFTEDQIGDVLAKREILAHLRETGEATGGPRPMSERHRSEFLDTLHRVVEKSLRERRRER